MYVSMYESICIAMYVYVCIIVYVWYVCMNERICVAKYVYLCITGPPTQTTVPQTEKNLNLLSSNNRAPL